MMVLLEGKGKEGRKESKKGRKGRRGCIQAKVR